MLGLKITDQAPGHAVGVILVVFVSSGRLCRAEATGSPDVALLCAASAMPAIRSKNMASRTRITRSFTCTPLPRVAISGCAKQCAASRYIAGLVCYLALSVGVNCVHKGRPEPH